MDNNNTPQGAMPQMKPAAQPAGQPMVGQPLAGRTVARPVAQPTQFANGMGAQPMSAPSVARPVTGAQPMASQATAQPMAPQATAQPVASVAGAAAGMAAANATAGYRSTYAQSAQQPTMPQEEKKDTKKNGLLIGGIIGGAALLLVIVLAIVMINMNRVDYKQSYTIATDLKTTVDAIYGDEDCQDVAEYADIASVSDSNYAEYIAGCSAIFENNAPGLISQLGQTDGVQKNDEIAAQYAVFSNAYGTMVSEISDDLDSKLALYQAWHQFIVAVDSLTYADSTDEQFQAAAAYLTGTGNQSFINYAQGWLDRSIQIANTYRAYNTATWNQESLHQQYEDQLTELLTWIEGNRPNFATLAPLDFTTASTMYTEFNKLYTLITDNYQG